MKRTSSQRPFDLIGAIQARKLGYAVERQREQAKRNEALAAILARLEAARRDNAERYLVDRVKRETSRDLS